MDTIQLGRELCSKKKNQTRINYFLKRNQYHEEIVPLFIAYLAWIRTLHGTFNKFDIIHQHEQINCCFKFLCLHNLLFFLTATRQFTVIEKLFSSPPFITQLNQVIAFKNRELNNIEEMKRNRLLQLQQKHPFFSSKKPHKREGEFQIKSIN